MTLVFPSAESFAQQLKLTHRTLSGDDVIVVVEGSTDRRALTSMLARRARIVPANGRDIVLGAYRALQSNPLDRCLFVADCDGNFPDDLKGLSDLIITSHRDIEADLMFELRGHERISMEYLGEAMLPIEETYLRSDEAFSLCSSVVYRLGITKDAARGLGLRLRYLDVNRGQRIRISLADLPSAQSWLGREEAPGFDEIVQDMAFVLGWSDEEARRVESMADLTESALCRTHTNPICTPCLNRRFCNGHDMVIAFALHLEVRLGQEVSAREIDRHLRLGADRTLITRWNVAERIRRWEMVRGLPVLAA